MLDYLQGSHTLGARALQILEGKSFILHKGQCSCLLTKLGEMLNVLENTVESCRDKKRVAKKCREVFKEIYLVVQNVKNFVHACFYEDEKNFVIAAIRVAAHRERFNQYHVRLNWCILLIGCLEDDNFYGNRVDCQIKLEAFDWELRLSSLDTSMVKADEEELKDQLRSWITKQGDHQAICKVLLSRFEVPVPDRNLEVPKPVKEKLKDRDLIGEGGQGSVYKVKWKTKEFAVKKLKFQDEGNTNETEVRILGDCCHPNIVNFILAHKKKGHHCVMMDLLPMHLQYYIEQRNKEKRHFHHLEVVEMISQICEGMMYLNDPPRKVSHRDLKPRNILVNLVEENQDFMEMQLADFGLAKDRMKGREQSSTSVNTPNTGTTVYRAPEMAQEVGSKTRLKVSSLRADIYSFAVTCSCILTGKEPLLDEVRRNERPVLPEDCPPALASLLERCWRQEPSERPRDFSEIRTELRKVKANLLSEILTVDEEHHQRLGVPSETPGEPPVREPPQRLGVPSETPGEPPVREPPLANNGSETFRPGDRRMNVLVLGDSDLVEDVVSRICGAASRKTEFQDNVPSLTESRNSCPPLCLYGDTKGIDRRNFTNVRAFVNARNGGWLQKCVKSLWQDEIFCEPASLPDSTLRLHLVWFVCRQISDLPNRFKWAEISEKLCGLPVQILVIGKQRTPDYLDSRFNKIFEHRSWYFPKLEEAVVKEHLIVKVFLTDGDLKEKLWRICWAAKTRPEIEYAAKLINAIRKELGQGGISIPIGVGGAIISKEFTLSQSGKFIVNVLSTFWDIPQEAIHGALQDNTAFEPAPKHAIIIKRCEFVKFCLQVAAIILYNAGKNRPEFMYKWDFTSESGSQLLQAQECYDRYFPSSVGLSSYDKMESKDIQDFLQSIFERKPCPSVSGHGNRPVRGSKFVEQIIILCLKWRGTT